MKKIGFLVQQDFLTKHFGVRNYILTLKEICAEYYVVDYLIHTVTCDGVFWYKCDVSSFSDESPVSPSMKYCMEKNDRTINYSGFEHFIKEKEIKQHVKNCYFRGIGDDLGIENYDLVIFTNPWIVDFDNRIPAKKLMGIVHDLIPNEYSLTKTMADLNLAHQQNRGYKYYINHCSYIYASSSEGAAQFNHYYNTDRCNFFPPVPPYAYKHVTYDREKKENAVILAAPFDPRKGIEYMPELLNGASDLIETIYIFGMPRCPIEMFDNFFKSLKIRRVEYFPYITTEELITLYKKCKCLLFPSLDEGLGIPIIEAQVCGCRVVTTDKEPMRSLIENGGYLLKEHSTQENIENLRSLMASDDFDYAELSNRAKERFSYDHILSVLQEVIEGKEAEYKELCRYWPIGEIG